MRKMVFIIWVGMGFLSQANNKLSKYYKGEIDLTEKEVVELVEVTLSTNTSAHIKSYAYYLKALREEINNSPFSAYKNYDNALESINKADTTDHFLYSAILRNQGAILHDYDLLTFSIEKHEQALEYAYEYSTARGLSVKFNMAWVLSKVEPIKALDILMEVIEEAYEIKDYNRSGKSFLEISKIYNSTGDYAAALEFSDEALIHAEDTSLMAKIYHNKAHTYYLMKDYVNQRLWLEKSLEARNSKDRFISLMDLGESYLLTNDELKAGKVLNQALEEYSDQFLTLENIKVYELLSKAFPTNQSYIMDQIRELKKYIETQDELEVLLKQQAMTQLLLRLEKQKEMKSEIRNYQIVTFSSIATLITIASAWVIWVIRLRKRLQKKVRENYYLPNDRPHLN